MSTSTSAPAYTREQTLPEVLAFARVFDERLEHFAQRTVDEIFASLPRYGEAPAAVREDALAHTVENFRVLQRLLAEGRAITAEDLAYTRLHAARRVQRGVPMKDFLEAFRIGHRVIWEVVLETLAGDRAGERAALHIAGALIQFFNVASANAAETYLEAQQLLLAEDDRHRRDLLEDLLAGAEPQPGPGMNAARAAGLGATEPLLVALARPVTLPDTESALRTTATSVAHAGGGATVPLCVVRRNEIVVVRSARSAGPADVETALRRTHEALAHEGIPLAIGVSTVHEGWGEVAAAYREALAALDQVAREGGVIALAGMSALDYLTRRRDETASRLIAPEILAFIEDDAAQGATLIETLSEYASSDMNATAAADRLHIHPNTARYRLARIAERTGRDLRCLSDVMELVIAVRLAAPRG